MKRVVFTLDKTKDGLGRPANRVSVRYGKHTYRQAGAGYSYEFLISQLLKSMASLGVVIR